MLVEREPAIAVLEEVAQVARAGTGGAVFMVGGPGTGKTTLLAAAAEMAGPLMRVVTARGSAMEVDLAFAFADQFAGPMLARSWRRDTTGIDSLAERAAVYDAARTRLRALSSAGPVMLVLDDLHWSDPDSLGLVGFLTRRLAALPVALVAGMRPWPSGSHLLAQALAGDGLARLVCLEPLSEAGSAELLGELVGSGISDAVLGAELVARAWRLTRGNPVLIHQAARSIAEYGNLPEPSAGALAGLQRTLLLGHMLGLSSASLECARVAAVLGDPCRIAAVEGVVKLGGDVELRPQVSGPDAFADTFDSLVASGVLRDQGGGCVRFDHDLLRAAVYEDMAPARRRTLHIRAFRYYSDLGDVAAAAPHALAGDLVGDSRAIEVLLEAAERALGAGATESALANLASALELAGAEADEDLLIRYADTLFMLGRPADALAVFRGILEHPAVSAQSPNGGPRPRADITAKMARAQAFSGQLAESLATYDRLLASPAELGPGLVPTMLERAHVAWEMDGPLGALAALEAPGVGPNTSETTGKEMLSLARAFFRLQMGDPSGLGEIEAAAVAAIRGLRSGQGDAAATFSAVGFQVAALGITERFEEAAALIDEAGERARTAGTLRAVVPLRTVRLGTLIMQGRLFEALVEADDLVETLEVDPLLVPGVMLMRAQALVWLGRSTEARQLCDTAAAMPGAQSWFPRLTLGVIRAHRLIEEGRPAEALQVFRQVEAVVERYGIGHPEFPMWAAVAVEAALAAGCADDVARLAGWLEGRRGSLTWPRMVAFGARAALAALDGDHATAQKLYRSAAEACSVTPLDRATILARYGSWLRRRGQVSEAREVLAEVVRVAEACGAAPLASRAGAELSAAGGRRRRTQDLSRLTVQEARVAQLALTGASTAEIASALSISPRTVETQLGHVYLKLGLTSRSELRRRRAELASSVE
jgi:DNA-binding CsgD family transcriptional regulator